MRRVGIRLCGGCNPGISLFDVVRDIRALGEGITFVGAEEEDLDAYLFVCGCADTCPVDELGFRDHPKAIVVEGDVFDGQSLPEHLLPQAVVNKLLELPATSSPTEMQAVGNKKNGTGFEKRKVGIRFCGGCNPGIERMEVFRSIQKLTEDITFVGFEEDDLEAYLFICGCPDACPVDELGFRGHPKSIVVAGDLLDDRPLPDRVLPKEVVAKLSALLK